MIKAFSSSMCLARPPQNFKLNVRYSFVFLIPLFVLNYFPRYTTFNVDGLATCSACPPRNFKTTLMPFVCAFNLVIFVPLLPELSSNQIREENLINDNPPPNSNFQTSFVPMVCASQHCKKILLKYI